MWGNFETHKFPFQGAATEATAAAADEKLSQSDNVGKTMVEEGIDFYPWGEA